MAAVQGPSVAHHPTSFDKISKMPRSTPGAQKSSADPYYGHEATAKLCSRFVTHLFACPEYPTGVLPSSSPPPTLAQFVAYALHRTRLHQSVTFAALYLLQRLKQRFPAARGSSGHRLFLSAFMIASKVICDDTYSNKSWCIVGQGMFALREINQMEREMCSYLEWELNVDPTSLSEFERLVRKEFSGPGPYTSITLPTPTKTVSKHSHTSDAGIAFLSAKPMPQDPIPTSPPKPYINPDKMYPRTPESPSRTPEMSRSETPSPASTCSPATPASTFDSNPQIIGAYPDFPPPSRKPSSQGPAAMAIDYIPPSLKAAQMAKAIPGTGPGKFSTGPPKPVPSKISKFDAPNSYAYARASRW